MKYYAMTKAFEEGSYYCIAWPLSPQIQSCLVVSIKLDIVSGWGGEV